MTRCNPPSIQVEATSAELFPKMLVAALKSRCNVFACSETFNCRRLARLFIRAPNFSIRPGAVSSCDLRKFNQPC